MAGGFSTVGLITIRRATVSIPDGATSVVWSHNIGRVPFIAHMPSSEQGLNAYYSGKTATQVTINTQSPVVGNTDIDVIGIG